MMIMAEMAALDNLGELTDTLRSRRRCLSGSSSGDFAITPPKSVTVSRFPPPIRSHFAALAGTAYRVPPARGQPR